MKVSETCMKFREESISDQNRPGGRRMDRRSMWSACTCPTRRLTSPSEGRQRGSSLVRFKRPLAGAAAHAANHAAIPGPIFKICPGAYFGTPGWSKTESSRNFMQVSLIFITFRWTFFENREF